MAENVWEWANNRYDENQLSLWNDNIGFRCVVLNEH